MFFLWHIQIYINIGMGGHCVCKMFVFIIIPSALLCGTHISILVGRQSVQKDQAQLKELLNNLNKFMSEQKKAEVKVAQLREQLQLMEQVVAGNAKLVASGKEQVSAVLTPCHHAPPPPPGHTNTGSFWILTSRQLYRVTSGLTHMHIHADTHRNARHRSLPPLHHSQQCKTGCQWRGICWSAYVGFPSA